MLERHWRLTWPWAPWDLEHGETRARIEIKQSAARQPWHRPGHTAPPPTRASFSINKPSNVYYLADGAKRDTPLQRHADLYVFAWHPEKDLDIADHRRPNQWTFFVVEESKLPKQKAPEQKAISIGVEALAGAQYGGYDALPAMVATVLKSLGSSLKAATETGWPG